MDAEAMCHKAFTYELFAQMTRDVLNKLDKKEQVDTNVLLVLMK